MPITDLGEILAGTKSWPHSFHGLISRTASQYPDKIALTFHNDTYTYRALVSKANQLAHHLIAQGVQPHHIIAIIMDRGPDMLIAMLAVLRTGASYLPIDPAYPENFIRFMLEDSAAAFMISTDSARYGGTACTALGTGDLSAYPTDDPQTEIDGSMLAYTLYTSGSTGRPKGVQIEHHSLLNFLTSMQQLLSITPLDKLLAVTTISFDISGLELYLPLIAGAEIVLTDTHQSKDARLLLDILRKKDITMMQATPSTWRSLFDAGWTEPLNLKILCGGEPMTMPLASRLLSQGSKLWNLYGPTETTIWSTIREIQEKDTQISIGLPIARTQIYILDDQLQPVPDGQPGEICIGGEGVARGYLNRPELDAQRFVRNPFTNDASKLYRTGDSGSWQPNGQIHIHGRIDAQIKIRGYRIEPGEIESALVRYPIVKEAVVKGKDDQLIAWLTLTAQDAAQVPLDLQQYLRQSLRNDLPEHMIPRQFIVLKAFPMTPNGKIDKNRLPEEDDTASESRAKAYAPPRSETEKLVAAIWSAALSRNAGLYDDYFEMGGDSISALRIMARLEQQTGRRLPLSILFKAPTVEKLAAVIDTTVKVSWDQLVLIRPGSGKQPLYIVQGYGMNVLGFNSIARHMHPDTPVYGFQPKGADGISTPHDTIAAIAKDYVDAIINANPDGPYCLAGYSYGGVVAFEMAQQLRAAGRTVSMLAIIDTYANNWKEEEDWKRKIIRKAARQLPKFRFLLRNMQQYPRETLKYQRDYFTRKAMSFIHLFHRPQPTTTHTPEERIDMLYQQAYHQYRMRPYDGDIDLFRVNIRLYFLDDMEYMGWKVFVNGSIHIHEVPGDHSTFLLPPNDSTFAEVLQKTMLQRLAEI